jgi:hypothetical protein
MLIVHAGIPLPRLPPAKGIHDLSNLRPADMLDTLETICQHKSVDKVWVGFLDPLWMLTEPERIRMRDCIRKLEITMVCSNPRALPYSWKAEMTKLLVYENEKPFTKHKEE